MKATLKCCALAFVVAGLVACSEAPQGHHRLGYVETEWIYVPAPQAGWVISQKVEKGARVTTGEVLFELDADRQQAALKEAESLVAEAKARAGDAATGAREAELRALQARLHEAQARLALARKNLQRLEPLLQSGYAEQSQGDQARLTVAMNEAVVEALRRDIEVAELAARPQQRAALQAKVAAAEATRQRADYELRQRRLLAPRDGQVSDIFLREGEYAKAGSPVLVISPSDRLKVRFFVPQGELSSLAQGTSVQVIADGLPEPRLARVNFIAQDAEFVPPVIYAKGVREKLVFLVEARLDDGAMLHPGLPVEVRW